LAAGAGSIPPGAMTVGENGASDYTQSIARTGGNSMMQNEEFAGNRLVRICAGASLAALMATGALTFAPISRGADAGYIRIVSAQGTTLDGGSKEAGHLNWVSVSSVVAADLDGDARADRESSAPAVSEVTAGSSSAARVSAPRDVATGMASGKRMHKPFTITKTVDSASPLLAKACASGEHLKEVDVELASGGHYKLSDVVVASDAKSAGGETISFTYQKIEISK
jgi:type VI protein secretion system component Hcp